jgi:hypothetical protein
MQALFLKKTCEKGIRKGWLLKELVTMAKTLELSPKGNKKELCDRISEYFIQKGESVTFFDFVKDGNLEKIKEFHDIDIKDNTTAIHLALDYGYLNVYTFLNQFPSNFILTLLDIINALNKGYTQLVLYLYTQYNKKQEIKTIDNQVDSLLVLFSKEIPKNNYLKYIELSNSLRDQAELVKQIELLTNTFT